MKVRFADQAKGSGPVIPKRPGNTIPQTITSDYVSVSHLLFITKLLIIALLGSASVFSQRLGVCQMAAKVYGTTRASF
jgi:hypothetical protein